MLCIVHGAVHGRACKCESAPSSLLVIPFSASDAAFASLALRSCTQRRLCRGEPAFPVDNLGACAPQLHVVCGQQGMSRQPDRHAVGAAAWYIMQPRTPYAWQLCANTLRSTRTSAFWVWRRFSHWPTKMATMAQPTPQMAAIHTCVRSPP